LTLDELQDLFDYADDRVRSCPQAERRSVLTVPRAGWAVDCLKQWIEEVRPPRNPARNTHPFGPPSAAAGSAPSLTREFTLLRTGLGLADGIDFHSLRRSYVTHLIEDGYDALFVQQQV
jgi:integrase